MPWSATLISTASGPARLSGKQHPGVFRAVVDRVLQQVTQGGDDADPHRRVRPVVIDGAAASSMPRAPAFILAPVQRLGHHRVQVDRKRVRHRLGGLDPGQRDQVLDQAGEPRRLIPHPAGEAAHRLRVVRGVLHGLGQQGKGTDRRLQLMADVGDKIPPDFTLPGGSRSGPRPAPAPGRRLPMCRAVRPAGPPGREAGWYGRPAGGRTPRSRLRGSPPSLRTWRASATNSPTRQPVSLYQPERARS